jgi:hypothetical protein
MTSLTEILGKTVISNAQDCPKKFVPIVPFPNRLGAPKKGSKFNDIWKCINKCRSTFHS